MPGIAAGGVLLLASDEIALTSLWMEGQKYFAATLVKMPSGAAYSLPVAADRPV